MDLNHINMIKKKKEKLTENSDLLQRDKCFLAHACIHMCIYIYTNILIDVYIYVFVYFL